MMSLFVFSALCHCSFDDRKVSRPVKSMYHLSEEMEEENRRGTGHLNESGDILFVI